MKLRACPLLLTTETYSTTHSAYLAWYGARLSSTQRPSAVRSSPSTARCSPDVARHWSHTTRCSLNIVCIFTYFSIKLDRLMNVKNPKLLPLNCYPLPLNCYPLESFLENSDQPSDIESSPKGIDPSMLVEDFVGDIPRVPSSSLLEEFIVLLEGIPYRCYHLAREDLFLGSPN